MRTIRVTGKGQLKVHPDRTRIVMTLTGMFPEYGDAMAKSAVDTEKLKDELAPFGFERPDVKTLRFSVDTRYESYEVNKVRKQRLLGYEYTHVLKVEFPSDNKRLGKILFALAWCSLKPEFRISYTVKDPEAVKNELLAKAVKDAAAKAGVLSGAAGLTLGAIQSMDYSWGEIDFEVRPMRDLCAPTTICENGFGGYDLDIEPDDIDAEDTVTVVWEVA